MSHPIFDSAIAALHLASQHLDTERQRNTLATDESVAIQKRMETLRKNEGDLNTIVNELAQKIAQSREKIAAADVSAAEIMSAARAQANDIVVRAQNESRTQIEEAGRQADDVKARALAKADDIIATAKSAAARSIDDANSELSDVRSQITTANDTLAALSRQIAAEQTRLEALKKKQ